jgi:acetamidase/formamidase
MSAIDAYSLMSLTMGSRLGDIAESRKSVHCLVPKNLWNS